MTRLLNLRHHCRRQWPAHPGYQRQLLRSIARLGSKWLLAAPVTARASK